jgi:hypothetical protein
MMAEVVVFVDDAVRGQLPDICVKDGVPARGRLRVVHEVNRSNRLGILWLLVFAGPPGWLVLLLLAARNDGEQLAVELPYSDEAYERLRGTRRSRNVAVFVGVFGAVGLLLLTAWAQLGTGGFALILGAVVGALIAIGVAEDRLARATVDVQLDASRRWVTLRRVHPTFAAAYAEREQARTRQHH